MWFLIILSIIILSCLLFSRNQSGGSQPAKLPHLPQPKSPQTGFKLTKSSLDSYDINEPTRPIPQLEELETKSQDQTPSTIIYTYRYLAKYWNLLFLHFADRLNSFLDNQKWKDQQVYLEGEWTLNKYDLIAYQANGLNKPENQLNLYKWRVDRMKRYRRYLRGGQFISAEKENQLKQEIPDQIKETVKKILQVYFHSLFNTYPPLLYHYFWTGFMKNSETNLYVVTFLLNPHPFYQLNRFYHHTEAQESYFPNEAFMIFDQDLLLEYVGVLDARYFGNYQGRDDFFPSYASWDVEQPKLSVFDNDQLLNPSLGNLEKELFNPIIQKYIKSRLDKSSQGELVKKMEHASSEFSKEKRKIKEFECHGAKENHLITPTLCRLRGGIWDRDCQKNTDCPYYQINQNYPNDFGGCNKTTGKCQMPKGVKRLSSRYPENPEDAEFYNCQPEQGVKKGCLDGEYPDYKFENDLNQRRKHRKQLKAKGLEWK